VRGEGVKIKKMKKKKKKKKKKLMFLGAATAGGF